jgi:hypothetical protein
MTAGRAQRTNAGLRPSRALMFSVNTLWLRYHPHAAICPSQSGTEDGSTARPRPPTPGSGSPFSQGPSQFGMLVELPALLRCLLLIAWAFNGGEDATPE